MLLRIIGVLLACFGAGVLVRGSSLDAIFSGLIVAKTRKSRAETAQIVAVSFVLMALGPRLGQD